MAMIEVTDLNSTSSGPDSIDLLYVQGVYNTSVEYFSRSFHHYNVRESITSLFVNLIIIYHITHQSWEPKQSKLGVVLQFNKKNITITVEDVST